MKIKGPILITGHTGFKGTWLTLFLRQLGYEVIGYSLKPDKNSLYSLCNLHGVIPEIFGDINDRSKLENFLKIYKPEAIFHLAANALVLNSYDSPFKHFKTNTLGTASLLTAASNFSFVRVIGVITTDKVYSSDSGKNRFTESDKLQGFDPYSESKVGAEAAVRAWRHLNSLSGRARILALRSGNVIGGGDTAKNRLIPDIIEAYKEGTSVSVRNKNYRRPWMYVLDTLYGYSLAILNFEAHAGFYEFNFAPKESSLRVLDVVRIAETMLKSLKITYMKNEKTDLETHNLQLDATRANKVLGWYPLLNQEAAVIETFEWWIKLLSQKLSPRQLCEESILSYIQRIGIDYVKY